ncbi:tetratricopeptide repeat protein [Methylobacterium sp. J-076]|uniref:type III secretion apparatus assembly chaperone SctY n=1 Tax=Methylobacterium sp. J-076 TaxID=2836655 RepID=UPI001FB98734|nr:tetratricopeptide repeat protein [Methylobacterium sp. J-076]MCJ2013119.1 tetratricopeptide repeat protein [Methylobacterium sp. J-076]
MSLAPIARRLDGAPGPPAKADSPAEHGRPLITREQRDLLCAMAYTALGVGDAEQAVTLLSLVLREAPADTEVLRLLAYALVRSGSGGQALAALDRLAELEAGAAAPPLMLLRSQALRLAGRLEEGRALFRAFVAERRSEEPRR